MVENKMENNNLMIFKSFEKWGKSSVKYSDLFITFTNEMKEVPKAFFNEAKQMRTDHYEMWFRNNSFRYSNKLKQRELLLIHEIMYVFLTDFHYGKVNQSDESIATTSTGLFSKKKK
jgi:hypothetical protein